MSIRTDRSDLIVTTNQAAGELANWAVQQSPYNVPDNLAEAINGFIEAWPHDEQLGEELPMKSWASYQALREALDQILPTIPAIAAWNERKNGREGNGFSSRFEQPEPDDDFIDLGALANNIARSLWADACDFADFNAKFDEKYAHLSAC
jgi:hypothetical protein